MTVHFHKELETLRKQILAECTNVQDALIKAMTALFERDTDLAVQVIEGDDVVDKMEVEFEEACLKVLALHQPVAQDLRFIVAVLKMNNDLELMGDLTVNIAKRARFLCNHGPMAWPPELRPMFDNVKGMINGAMDALIDTDADKAREVVTNDDVVGQAEARDHGRAAAPDQGESPTLRTCC